MKLQRTDRLDPGRSDPNRIDPHDYPYIALLVAFLAFVLCQLIR